MRAGAARDAMRNKKKERTAGQEKGVGTLKKKDGAVRAAGPLRAVETVCALPKRFPAEARINEDPSRVLVGFGGF